MGGTAGLTIASPLATHPSISVGVTKAGGFYEADSGNTSTVPGDCAVYAGTDPTGTNPLVDWGFLTVPQAVTFYLNKLRDGGKPIDGVARGASNRCLNYACGKTLGGSSARKISILL